MNEETGEIKELTEEEERLLGEVESWVDEVDEGGSAWRSLPMQGKTVELTYRKRLTGGASRTFRSDWKVVKIVPGKPGRMVIEALPRRK